MIALMLLVQDAAAISNQYCFEYATAFVDAAFGDLLTGNNTKARGAKVRFISETTGATVAVHLDWDGANPGCKTVSLSHTDSYTIRVDRTAEVNGNTLEVRSAYGALYSSVVQTGFTPQLFHAYGPLSDHWMRLPPGNGTHVMAVAQWAMQRRSGGISGETFEFRVGQGSCEPGTACVDLFTHIIWIPLEVVIDNVPTGSPPSKFIIAHEFGHALAYTADDNWRDHVEPLDYGNAIMGPCIPGVTAAHRLNTREYQAMAASEGLAHFYAAIAFNHDTSVGADCELQASSKVDWNINGTEDQYESAIFSCNGILPGVGPNGVDVPAGNYVGAFCQGGPNQGTEFDWLRALWDLRTDHGVSFDTVLTIWNVADPYRWHKNGTGIGYEYPAYMMSAAAASQGLGAVWDSNAAFHGNHR